MTALRNRQLLSVHARSAAALWVIVVLASCAPPKAALRVDYDRAVNYSSFSTYTYVDPVGTDNAGYSSLTTQRFKQAIDAEMSARGYRKVDANPDLLINFNANATEKVDLESIPRASVSMGIGIGSGYYDYRSGMYLGMPIYSSSEISTVRYKVGTANVEIIDARQRRLLWEGVAEGRLTKKTMQDPQPAIASVVHLLFAQYPGRASGAAN
jgi:hypothetical protein